MDYASLCHVICHAVIVAGCGSLTGWFTSLLSSMLQPSLFTWTQKSWQKKSQLSVNQNKRTPIRAAQIPPLLAWLTVKLLQPLQSLKNKKSRYSLILQGVILSRLVLFYMTADCNNVSAIGMISKMHQMWICPSLPCMSVWMHVSICLILSTMMIGICECVTLLLWRICSINVWFVLIQFLSKA